MGLTVVFRVQKNKSVNFKRYQQKLSSLNDRDAVINGTNLRGLKFM